MVARRSGQRGLGLIEVLLATAIAAVLLVGVGGLVKLGLDAQTVGRGRNEAAYQARFALERIAERARTLAPKELGTPAAGTTGDWFAPAGCSGAACVMYCRKNATSELIETTTADTTCSGTQVIAGNVTAFAAQLPAGMGPADRSVAVLSLTLSESGATVTRSYAVRLGGGTQ